MAWGDDVLPLQERQQTVADQVKLEGVYNTERHLMCVAGTRARSPGGQQYGSRFGILADLVR
jgi:hypothetical protein